MVIGAVAIVGISTIFATQAATNTTAPAEAEPDELIRQAEETEKRVEATRQAAAKAEETKKAAAAAAAKQAAEKKANPAPAPAPAPPPAVSTQAASRGIRGQGLFVYKPAEWASRPRAIYDYQVGQWFGGWTTDLTGAVSNVTGQAAANGQLPLLVAYNIPNRDCGSYSAGGAGSSAAYRSWIQAFANGIGNRKAIVILEPDALPQTDCLDGGSQAARIADIAFAVDILRNQTQAAVYIDAGNSGWKPAATMADLLKQANVAGANGFALNVSNFRSTAESTAYGEQVVGQLASRGVNGARYVVDTSRNGQGPAPASPLSWCNPPGRGLGKRPTTSPDSGAHNDAFLWIKTAGESDGECGRGEPAAGQWFEEYAQGLINNAVY